MASRNRIWAAQLAALCVAQGVHAEDAPTPPGQRGPELEVIAAEMTPETESDAPSDRARWSSALGVGGVYVGMTTFTYFAWYHNKGQLPAFTVGGDGWFGSDTYAGGADKFGHMWINYVMTRGATNILTSGGWDRLPASLVSGAMSSAFWTFIEVKDGFYYQLSLGDIVGNLTGVALGIAMDNLHALDNAIDFRVEYFPSTVYWNNLSEDGDVNVAEDYSGQTYLLGLHLKALPRITEPAWMSWAKYVDLSIGFESRNYKPEPTRTDAAPRQSLFVGVSLNLQHALERAFGEKPAHWAHRAGHATFEVFAPPLTTLRVAGAERSP